MSQQIKYIVLGLVLLVSAGLIWMFSTFTENKSIPKKQYDFISSNWETSYQWDNKDPYGLFIFQDLLQKQIKHHKIDSINEPTSFLKTNVERNKTYLYIGENFGLENQEIEHLFESIVNGSDVIIASSNFTSNFIASLNDTLFQLSFAYEKSVEIQSMYQDHYFSYVYQQDTLLHDWTVFNKLPKNDIKIWSTLSGKANFIESKIAKGRLILITTPEVYCNVQLLDEKGRNYAEQLIKLIDPKKDVSLLNFARINPAKTFEEIYNESQNEGNGEQDDSYLQLLLKTPALRTALFLCFIGIFLYFVFRSKRMQPKIDVYSEKANKQKVFVNTIASIYKNQNYPYAILKLHQKNFYQTIQKHFFIDLSKNDPLLPTDLQQLAEKTNINIDEVIELTQKLNAGRKANIDEEYLINVVQLKQKFYEKSGIISSKISHYLLTKKFSLYRSLWQSSLLLLTTIFSAFLGLFLLVNANSLGILLVVLSALLLIPSIQFFNKPLLTIEDFQWKIQQNLYRSIDFHQSEILQISQVPNGVNIHLKNQDVMIPFHKLNKIEINQLIQYLHKNNLIKL